MATRAQSAAVTRDALIRAASELLNAGGPDAVTLRAVGARAGVSRGAPYGHFDDKEHLLTQLAIHAWNEVAAPLVRLHGPPRQASALEGTARSGSAANSPMDCRSPPVVLAWAPAVML